jgi:hypothetical protein
VRGLHIPGAIVIGRAPCSGNAGGADLSDVDLTAARIDRRVKFQCASHRAYYAADGTIQFAEPDVWPLEYVNGVAVGRHEPEPQSTNYVPYSNDLSKSIIYDAVSVALSGTKWRGLDGYSISGPYTYSLARIATFTAAAGQHYTLSVIADLSTAQQLRFEFNRSAIARRGYVFTATTATASGIDAGNIVTLHGYKITQLDEGVYRFSATASFSAAGPATLRIGVNKNDTAAAAIVYFCQEEDSDIATSPILTTGAAAMRAAAFATVTNPGGQATAIRVHYSDGTTDEYDFGANGSDIQLPQSATNWGTRYITRIQYARGF